MEDTDWWPVSTTWRRAELPVPAPCYLLSVSQGNHVSSALWDSEWQNKVFRLVNITWIYLINLSKSILSIFREYFTMSNVQCRRLVLCYENILVFKCISKLSTFIMNTIVFDCVSVAVLSPLLVSWLMSSHHVHTRASNEPSRRLREFLQSQSFSWFKPPTRAFTFKILWRH